MRLLEAAAIAFTSDDLVNGTFELAAGGMATRSELAALMTRHAGRGLVAQDADTSAALQGVPNASLRDGLLAMFADYTARGFRGGNSLALRTILGRTPRSLDDFFAELARSLPTTPQNARRNHAGSAGSDPAR